jgi:FtsP/CotA-like multicopper oxidase with cupredoxin domain
VNNRLFNVNVAPASIPKGSAEIWELVGLEKGWQHPVHIHFEEGRIIGKSVAGVNVRVPVRQEGKTRCTATTSSTRTTR